MARCIRSRPLYLLLVLALLASPALAVGRHAPAPAASKAALSSSWAKWAWSAFLNVFARSGGQMDPNGATVTKPSTPPTASTMEPPATADSGGQMDPDG